MTIPTYKTLHNQAAIIIHNGNSCTSWEDAQKMADDVLQGLLSSLPAFVQTGINQPFILAEKIAEVYQQLLGMRK